ncbi:adhesin [Georgenia wangjunii]|uniref:adhesin n=1 Tax=Georgenia wangjunii TaxID=3117730 RepID=UPI002F26A668
MLTLTETAKSAIVGITAQAGLPETGGVRIALAQESDQIELSLVPEPEAGDDVIDAEGARVFVQDAASPVLADHTLDAAESAEGIGFALVAQD